MREILIELDSNLTEEELDQMIDEIDADGSGTVDFEGKIYIYVNLELSILKLLLRSFGGTRF